MSEPHTYTFDVAMTCGGCSGAVERVLSKLDGLEIEKVDWQTKEVVVKAPSGTPDFETVRQKIAKTGKTVNRGEDNGVQKWPVPETASA